MVRSIMDHVAALAETFQVALPVVARIMIEMRRRQDDAGLSERHRLLDIRPSRWPAPTITPRVARGVEPATIGQATDSLTMRPAASLADTTGALEAHASADLRPVDRVEPAQLTLDRQSSPLFTMESVYRRFCRPPAIVANPIRQPYKAREATKSPCSPVQMPAWCRSSTPTKPILRTGSAAPSVTRQKPTRPAPGARRSSGTDWRRQLQHCPPPGTPRLLTPDEVRRTAADSQILLKAGASSIFARKLRYYADPEFRGLFDAATEAASGKKFHGYEASYHHRSR